MDIRKQFDKRYQKLLKEHRREEKRQKRKMQREINLLLLKNKIKYLILSKI